MGLRQRARGGTGVADTVSAILAVDPGTTASGYVLLPHTAGAPAPLEFGKIANADLIDYLINGLADRHFDCVVCEQIASYGMPVGAEVFSTVEWSGRFHQIVAMHRPATWVYLPRRAVKLELCDSPRANDASIRQALADLYGGSKVCKGTKRSPGPLYGVSGDCWAALGLGVTYLRQNAGECP